MNFDQLDDILFNLSKPYAEIGLHYIPTNMPSDLIFNGGRDNARIRSVTHRSRGETPLHSHSFFELMYVCNGEIIHHINSDTYVIPKGSILLLPPGMSHSIDGCPPEYLAVNFLIQPSYFDAINLSRISTNDYFYEYIKKGLSDTPLTQPLFLKSDASNELISFARQLIYETLLPDKHSLNNVECFMPAFLNLLERHCVFCNYIPKQKPHVQLDIPSFLQYLRSNADKKITLSEAASRFGYVPNYFSVLVQQAFGCSFTDLLRNERLLKSAYLLKNTECSVSEIISLVGLSNRSYFYRIFTNKYGMGPVDYRIKMKEAASDHYN